MSEATSHVASILNTLIETAKDGQAGYHTAADAVRNPTLKELFQSYSGQRERFATELQEEVRKLGGQPEERGSLVGTLLRGWTNLKGLVTGGDENAIVTECARSEDNALRHYETALKEDLPADVHALVERQHARVKEAAERIHALGVVTAKLA